ncbi:myb family transcription factor PHL8-like isoform X2 [Juglans microcarpa x Juglans regia]|uniref:myb family transcription factor PHL8-like isoform X2 n=1 Tax=Juglans microcarpa x Juglans regia TaxID=2249226 RepID=UPI001B7E5AA6|nr:myb family transcription factor PHL8-like isoform X2 [Juglans microcarpa x Juglans regia]
MEYIKGRKELQVRQLVKGKVFYSYLIRGIETGLQIMQNQKMNLVLSTDAKPRLKWTAELHQRFVEAVEQLGGAEKATPKSLMRVMGIPGLTLYHLKSHLQKYRLGKSQQPESCSDNKEKDYGEIRIATDGHFSREVSDAAHNQINDSQIAQALQLQMEVHRKLHDQIEVQRHLQLRIEAQGKYLQSVLKKAQETLTGYNSSPQGLELAKAELSHLVSIVNTGCPSSSISELTETGDFSVKDIERKQIRGTICSMESSLTSSESSGRKEEKRSMKESGDPQKSNATTLELSLMDIHPGRTDTSNQASERKRSRGFISDGICVEQPVAKRSPTHRDKSGNPLRKSGLLEKLDLNSKYQHDIDSGPKTIDLNCKGLERCNGLES